MPARSAARAARPTSSSSSLSSTKPRPPCEPNRTAAMTQKKKADKPAVTTFADHEVILPPNKLKKAVVKEPPGTVPDGDPVARAEAALAELAGEFSVWMEHECQRLDDARSAVRDRGLTAAG